MLPILESDKLGIAHRHINSDFIEWQTHQRDIWRTDHECRLQTKVNTNHEHSQGRYIQNACLKSPSAYIKAWRHEHLRSYVNNKK